MMIKRKMVKKTSLFISSYPEVAFQVVLNAEVPKLWFPIYARF